MSDGENKNDLDKLPPFTPLRDALFGHKEGKRHSGVATMVRRVIMSFIARKFKMGWKNLSVSHVADSIDLHRQTVAKHWAILAKDRPGQREYLSKAFADLDPVALQAYVTTAWAHTRKRVRHDVSTPSAVHVPTPSAHDVPKASPKTVDGLGTTRGKEKCLEGTETDLVRDILKPPPIGSESTKDEGPSVTSPGSPLFKDESRHHEVGPSPVPPIKDEDTATEYIPQVDLDKINRMFPNEPPCVSLGELAEQMRREGKLK